MPEEQNIPEEKFEKENVLPERQAGKSEEVNETNSPKPIFLQNIRSKSIVLNQLIKKELPFKK